MYFKKGAFVMSNSKKKKSAETTDGTKKEKNKKEKIVETKDEKKESVSAVDKKAELRKKAMKGVKKVDDNRKIIYAFVVGLIIGLGIMVLFIPERIAELKDGTQPVAEIKNKTFTADELYESMKQYYSVSLLLDKVDREILDKKYPTTDEMLSEIKETADGYISQYEQYGYTKEQFLEGNGFKSYDDFVEYLSLDHRRNLYLDDTVKSEITDDEINKYYDDKVFGDIDTKHILVPTGNDGDLSDEDAKKKAEEIIEKLNNGSSFDDVKEEYKDDTTYEELGYKAFDASLESAYMDAMKSLENGTYTKEPVKTSYGYHVIYRIDQKEKPSIDDVKDSIIDSILADKKSKDSNLLYKKLIKLREDNGLEFKDTVMKGKYDSYCKNYK